MANQLKMAVMHAILRLARLGRSHRRIAQVLGVDRETVGRYVHSAPADSNSGREWGQTYTFHILTERLSQ